MEQTATILGFEIGLLQCSTGHMVLPFKLIGQKKKEGTSLAPKFPLHTHLPTRNFHCDCTSGFRTKKNKRKRKILCPASLGAAENFRISDNIGPFIHPIQLVNMTVSSHTYNNTGPAHSA